MGGVDGGDIHRVDLRIGRQRFIAAIGSVRAIFRREPLGPFRRPGGNRRKGTPSCARKVCAIFFAMSPQPMMPHLMSDEWRVASGER